jgi:hypothetical protein
MSSDLHAPPQHVDPYPRGVAVRRSHPHGSHRRSMHDRASELLRIPLPRTSVNKGKMKGRASSISAPFAEGLLLRYYYRPGRRCSASPALRIASMPSSTLSSAVVFTAVRCPGALAATSMAAPVLGSGAS